MKISADNRSVLKFSLNLLIKMNQDILKTQELSSFTRETLENEVKHAKRAMDDISQWDLKK